MKGNDERDGERGVASDPATRTAGTERQKSLHYGSTHGRDNRASEHRVESEAEAEHWKREYENDLRWESMVDWESWEREGN